AHYYSLFVLVFHRFRMLTTKFKETYVNNYDLTLFLTSTSSFQLICSKCYCLLKDISRHIYDGLTLLVHTLALGMRRAGVVLKLGRSPSERHGAALMADHDACTSTQRTDCDRFKSLRVGFTNRGTSVGETDP
ncbi:hypothetical protein L9F63_002817, partial [Diploptera punctata]